MLSHEYCVKSNGRFWDLQWQIHKVFRSKMMKMNEDIITILDIKNVNELEMFKWSIFGRYWDVCTKGLVFSIDLLEKEYKEKESKKDDIVMVDDSKMDEDKEDELQENKSKERKEKERVITLFDTFDEKDVWKTELGIWTVDMAMQMIYGGDWLEICKEPYSILIENTQDWRGFLISFTQTKFSTITS